MILSSISRVRLLLALILLSLSTLVRAEEDTPIKAEPTVSELFFQAVNSDEELITGASPESDSQNSLIEQRVLKEAALLANDRGILAHNLNYFIPVSYKSRSNYNNFSPSAGPAPADPEQRNVEAEFQFSFKAALFDVFPKYNSKVYFGFTAQSWWQVYTNASSSPFRETNYEPEVFFDFPFRIKPLNIDFLNARIGLSHQSNGQNIPYSRSWNRVVASFEWESGNWVFQFKPWYRLPEDEKEAFDSVKGDDNPDITDYMGHFEFRAVLKNHRNEVAVTLRNNLHKHDNRGAIAFDWIFPTKHQLQPFVQLFHGYGDSLIDYNEEITRIGFGVLISNWY